MKKLSILEASKICGFNRTYFYKIIERYNITIHKDLSGHKYIEPSELVRAIPSEMINNELLKQTTTDKKETVPDTRNRQQQTLADSKKQTTTDNTQNDLINELLKQNKQLIEQNAIMLETIQKQMLMLEYKQTTTDKKETVPDTRNRQQQTLADSEKQTTQNNTELTSIFSNLRHRKY